MKLSELVKHACQGAVLALPFLATFMDKVATFSLVDATAESHRFKSRLGFDKTMADGQLLRTKDDIISFESPRDPGVFMIKRVKALENEQIYDTTKHKEIQVPRGHVWLEGDNKRASYDSRHFGCVPRGLVTGRALYIIWPPKRFGTKLTLLYDDEDYFS